MRTRCSMTWVLSVSLQGFLVSVALSSLPATSIRTYLGAPSRENVKAKAANPTFAQKEAVKEGSPQRDSQDARNDSHLVTASQFKPALLHSAGSPCDEIREVLAQALHVRLVQNFPKSCCFPSRALKTYHISREVTSIILKYMLLC